MLLLGPARQAGGEFADDAERDHTTALADHNGSHVVHCSLSHNLRSDRLVARPWLMPSYSDTECPASRPGDAACALTEGLRNELGRSVNACRASRFWQLADRC